MAVLHSYERAAELFAAGVLDPEMFISDRMPLEEYPGALEPVRGGQGTEDRRRALTILTTSPSPHRQR